MSGHEKGIFMDLKDKVVFITGGARGIGKEIACAFARHGACVTLGDVVRDACEKTDEEIAGYGTKAKGYFLDVSDFGSCEETGKRVLEDFGSIDVLVNNAGITRDNLLIRMSEDDFDRVVAINLKGTFNCTKAVARIMMKQRSGSIINIASVIGLIGNAGQANYAASKAGLIGITKSAAKELASRNITVNAIAPGFIETEMTGELPEEVQKQYLANIALGRPGTPLDVAHAALFFASDYSSYITGQVLVVDGGMVM
jgi:3-oxoacyl-[acyl-carrier protein] reductase